ncbi:PTS sugar transporter subunit IIA [Candidatus Sumerlaeota bacterium]|nr:PTS sugar transporter subunit IIA [Candidatus Sumerlaeota bacterium]
MAEQIGFPGKKIINFADRLHAEYIRLDLKSQSKDDAIRELADCLKENPNLVQFDRFLQDVFKREKEASTGIGNFVAIPHARTNSVKDFVVAIGRKTSGIEFESIDAKPVEIIILMGTPLEKVNLYLKLLAHLSHLLKRPGFIDGLKTAIDSQAVIDLFRKIENAGG